MTTMTERDVTRITPLDHDAAMRLGATEYERVGALLRSLDASDWVRATECEGWDVRAMASHLVGMVESLASPREFVSLGFRAWRRPEVYVDGMTAVQVDDRRSCTPAELIERYDRAVPKAMRTRTRLPKPLRALPLRFATPDGGVIKWNVAFLHDVILTRDNWMHRIDLARATGREMVTTPDHDGVLVADVVRDWARAHGQPCRLELEGAAGGTFRRGNGGESVGPIDAVEFCRILSGRRPGAGLLTTEVPF